MGSIQFLSAYLKKHGHHVALVQDPRLFSNPWIHIPWLDMFFSKENEIINTIKTAGPDIIGLSVVADDFEWAISWAKRIKEKLNVPIVMGNIGPTIDPHYALANSSIDFVVRGEGEIPFLKLISSIENKHDFTEIDGLCFKKDGRIIVNQLQPLISDLDSLPPPDKDLYYNTAPYFKHGYTTMTGRGCPYTCTFCDNSTSMKLYDSGTSVKNKWTRRRSPENVINELAAAKQKYHIKHIRFNDEDFSYSRKWLEAFCNQYIESKVGVPWFAWVYPNTINDEIASRMSRANCRSVEMGIQSGSIRIRNDIMKRRTSDEQIISACKALKNHGILCTVDVILGTPTETKEDLDRTVKLLRSCRPDYIYVFWLRLYEGTELFQLSIHNGWIDKNEVKQIGQKKISRGHLAGGTEIEKSKIARRYYTFIVLIPILPDYIVDFVIKRDLIKHTPHIKPLLLINFVKLFAKRPICDEFHEHMKHMYRYEIAKQLTKRFCSLLKKYTFRKNNLPLANN